MIEIGPTADRLRGALGQLGLFAVVHVNETEVAPGEIRSTIGVGLQIDKADALAQVLEAVHATAGEITAAAQAARSGLGRRGILVSDGALETLTRWIITGTWPGQRTQGRLRAPH